MVLTPSTMLPLGTAAPDFTLVDTEGVKVSLTDFADKSVIVIMFICNHCPYVVHIAPALARLAQDYAGRSVGVVAINSNDVRAYPEDNQARMAEERAARGYTFPYLLDESQEVAKRIVPPAHPTFLFLVAIVDWPTLADLMRQGLTVSRLATTTIATARHMEVICGRRSTPFSQVVGPTLGSTPR